MLQSACTVREKKERDRFLKFLGFKVRKLLSRSPSLLYFCSCWFVQPRVDQSVCPFFYCTFPVIKCAASWHSFFMYAYLDVCACMSASVCVFTSAALSWVFIFQDEGTITLYIHSSHFKHMHTHPSLWICSLFHSVLWRLSRLQNSQTDNVFIDLCSSAILIDTMFYSL